MKQIQVGMVVVLMLAGNWALAQSQGRGPNAPGQSGGAWKFTDLYDFQGSPDGNASTAGLVQDASGNLYGTTLSGGPKNPNCYESGCGTVFELAPGKNGSWKETVLHSFQTLKTDGCAPFGGVILDSMGNLYGTTLGCGAYGDGTVYELSPAHNGRWKFRLLHSFSGSKKDGAVSQSTPLMDAGGNLYGTTAYGGSHPEACQNKPLPPGCGVVWELVPGKDGHWQEKVLYSFAGGENDGANPPEGVAMDQQGNLYGVTKFGAPFQGTAYRLTPGQSGWTETVLHKFPTGNNDGTYPVGIPTLDVQGNLFGVTGDGGEAGLGTIWELSPGKGRAWSETVLFSFAEGGTSQPNAPYAGVILDANGNLYGTTVEGGSGCEGFGCGAVYRFSPKRRELSELLDFGTTTTNSPESPLLMDKEGNLYGTTTSGGAVGAPNCQFVLPGCGSVYRVSP